MAVSINMEGEMLQSTTADTDFDFGKIAKEGVDYLQTALATFGGSEGKAAAIAIEGIELLFDGELERLFDEGLEEVPPLVEKLSNGLVSQRSVKQIMYQVLKNETLMKTINAVVQEISDLIVKYIIEPMKSGMDFTAEKLTEFLGKLGTFAAPLKDLVSQVDKSIDNVMDNIEDNVKNAYKSVDASADEFVRKFEQERDGPKVIMSSHAQEVIGERVGALEKVDKVSKELKGAGRATSTERSINSDLISKAVGIIETREMRLSSHEGKVGTSKIENAKAQLKTEEKNSGRTI
ncbi:MAG: hypothetical protein MRQ07_00270 [Candidatus Midichloria sp.]|nr:hypothetical protein [Candidatus Midichloria sp.]